MEPSEADFLVKTDMVIGLSCNGVDKAFPLKILVWHEIVNDWFGDTPVVITYCPLCFSSIAFIRVVNGELVEFDTSGRLYNSDLVMYDRKPGQNQLTRLGKDLKDAGSLWSQIVGQAIAGPVTGYRLTSLPTDVMYWDDWKRLHPDTLVLSPDTGYSRNYNSNPYRGYFTNDRIFFPVDNKDDRLPEKEVIFGIEYDNHHKAYPVSIINEIRVINDIFQERGITIFKIGPMAVHGFETNINDMHLIFEINDGQFVDKETNSIWSEHGVAIEGPLSGMILNRIPFGNYSFWFAWVAFYHLTEVFILTE